LAEARAYASPGAADDARSARATFAGRLKLGWVEPVYGEARDLPLDRLFYAGGGGSVRGYGFRTIFPAADAARAIPPGGRGLIETSVEARLRVAQNWGLAAFVDGATVFDDATTAPGMRFGAGLGVRYDLGFAPLRLDVAFPIDRRPQDASAAVYLSLGQAF
jgi:translocation and assembly module TamA